MSHSGGADDEHKHIETQMVHSGAPAEDSIVMCLEADTRVCMLDRAVMSNKRWSNELFRFSTTKMQWEQLDAPQVSGSPPSNRTHHGMVAVGSDLYVFGGERVVTFGSVPDTGDKRRCDAGNRLAAWQIERRRCSARCCGACWHMLCSSGMSCRSAAPKSGDSGRHITPHLAP